MMNRSFNQQYSIYAQDNLFSSMQLLNEFDQNYITPAIKHKSGVKRPKYELATELIGKYNYEFNVSLMALFYHCMAIAAEFMCFRRKMPLSLKGISMIRKGNKRKFQTQ